MTTVDRDVLHLVHSTRGNPECLHTRGILADRLGEVGDVEREEYVRLGVELGQPTCEECGGRNRQVGPCGLTDYYRDCDSCKALTARFLDLESRLVPRAWPCQRCKDRSWDTQMRLKMEGVTCLACGGSGDLLKYRGPDWVESLGLTTTLDAACYVAAVTVPELGQLVARCPGCGVGPGETAYCDSCRGTGHVATPRLTALRSTPPWGVPLEAVTVADRECGTRERDDWGPPGGERFWWVAGSPADMPHRIPGPVFDRLGGVEYAGGKWFSTPDAATRALGRAVFAFGS